MRLSWIITILKCLLNLTFPVLFLRLSLLQTLSSAIATLPNWLLPLVSPEILPYKKKSDLIIPLLKNLHSQLPKKVTASSVIPFKIWTQCSVLFCFQFGPQLPHLMYSVFQPHWTPSHSQEHSKLFHNSLSLYMLLPLPCINSLYLPSLLSFQDSAQMLVPLCSHILYSDH